MSYAIGARIRELRNIHEKKQEDIALYLGTTRQRYARLENGQIDVSYVDIKNIADYFGVSTREITCAEEKITELVTFFREKSTAIDVLSSIAKIEEILKVFHAHEKLYYQNKE